jgi:hypothetical protein
MFFLVFVLTTVFCLSMYALIRTLKNKSRVQKGVKNVISELRRSTTLEPLDADAVVLSCSKKLTHLSRTSLDDDISETLNDCSGILADTVYDEGMDNDQANARVNSVIGVLSFI